MSPREARALNAHFPSFWEGLSLRLVSVSLTTWWVIFPFLFGRAFIEARVIIAVDAQQAGFPFLFGRAFIEARSPRTR